MGSLGYKVIVVRASRPGVEIERNVVDCGGGVCCWGLGVISVWGLLAGGLEVGFSGSLLFLSMGSSIVCCRGSVSAGFWMG